MVVTCILAILKLFHNFKIQQWSNQRADPDRPKNDKATIIIDTIQTLMDLTAEVSRLKAECVALSEESREVIDPLMLILKVFVALLRGPMSVSNCRISRINLSYNTVLYIRQMIKLCLAKFLIIRTIGVKQIPSVRLNPKWSSILADTSCLFGLYEKDTPLLSI